MGRESANRQRPKDLAELIGFVKLIDLLEGSHNRAFRETDRGFRSPLVVHERECGRRLLDAVAAGVLVDVDRGSGGDGGVAEHASDLRVHRIDRFDQCTQRCR